MSGYQRGRGGGRGGARGGYAGPRPVAPPDMSTSSLGPSLTQRLAVDGSPLNMANPVPAPARRPVPGNTVDPKIFSKVLEEIRAHGSVAEFPLRKTFHTTSTSVYTNHFAIKVDPKSPLYEYQIIGLPESVGRKTTKVLIQNMINNNKAWKDHENNFTTDYRESIISWVKLPQELLGPVDVSSREGRELISLSLELKGAVDTALLTRYAEGKAPPDGASRKAVISINRALNIIISSALFRESLSLKANEFFVTGGHRPLGGSLCTMRGYFYSVKPSMGQILLTLNACTSAFYQPILVSQFFNDNTFKSTKDRAFALQNVQVHLTYDPKHNGKGPRSKAAEIAARMKAIVSHGRPCKDQTFILRGKDGKPDETMTVQQHFQRTYNTTLRFPELPAINCGTREREMWYPPEVLQILPYQVLKRKVPEGLTSDMLTVACHRPEDTRTLIEHEGLKQLGLQAADGGFMRFADCPSVLIDPRMLKGPAAVLPYPTIGYGANGRVRLDGGNSKWNLVGRKFATTNARAPFKVYMICVPSGRSQVNENSARAVWSGFMQAAATYATGSLTYAGHTICLNFADPQIATTTLEAAKNKGANFVFLLLEKKCTSSYSNLKDLADRRFGMHSLCAVYKEDKRTGEPFGGQQWGNLMMKMNLKAGGTNHVVPDVSRYMADTLVLGADVTHAGPGSLEGTPSIAAVVGSVDKDGGKFLGSMRLQPKDTACEDIKDVKGMFTERLIAWHTRNKALPKNILYYRDGVSDSQYIHVKDNVLPQIREAFAAAAKVMNIAIVPKFKLTAVVVAKRHHVRFVPGTDAPSYARMNNGREGNGNCMPGTLVDTVVTSPYFQDFFLQSHDGIKGTAKPAHYFTLVNEMGLKETDLQEFTHKLCYTYVRATMGVSYAPPAYYADRLCGRGRCYLRNFLTPVIDSDFANGHKNMRTQLEKDFKDAREARFRSLRTRDARGRMVKPAAEKQKEDEDKVAIDAQVKQRTFEMAKKMFYGPTKEVRNPWRDEIAQTMFWM